VFGGYGFSGTMGFLPADAQSLRYSGYGNRGVNPGDGFIVGC